MVAVICSCEDDCEVALKLLEIVLEFGRDLAAESVQRDRVGVANYGRGELQVGEAGRGFRLPPTCSPEQLVSRYEI